MGSQGIYNETAIQNAINEISDIKSSISGLQSDINNFKAAIDKRIEDAYTSGISSTCDTLDDNNDGCTNFGSWLNGVYDDYENTRDETSAGVDDTSASIPSSGVSTGSTSTSSSNGAQSKSTDDSVSTVGGGKGSANSATAYYPDTDNISESDKSTIKAKLKELGFTDDEIQDILDGKVSVDKVKLQSLASELESLYKTDPSIRQLIIDKYGIDVFNDDGTVNKDKLAIIMIMDGKSSTDDYDLSALISSLKQTSSSNDTVTPITSNNSNDSDDSSSVGAAAGATVTGAAAAGASIAGSTSHSGVGSDGTLLETLATDEDDDKDKEEDVSVLLDSIIGKHKNTVVPDAESVTKTSASVAIPLTASLGAAAATAGGVGLFINKDKDEDDDNEDDDDIENYNENDQNIEKLNDDAKSSEDDKNNKEWLYGLGIGFSGAAAIAAEEKKRREDEKEDNELVEDFEEIDE